MKKVRVFALIVALTLVVFTVVCCTSGGAGSVDDDTSTTLTPMEESKMFSKRDLSGEYETDDAVFVTLSTAGFRCEPSKSVTISDDVLTINGAGVFVFSGSVRGQVVVDVPKTEKVQIVLNGAKISCEHSAAIYVRQADKVFVTVCGNDNTLETTSQFVAIDENNIDAALFSKDDLTVNGTGKLTINCAEGHGIVGKDDLVCVGVELNVTAKKSCLNANDSIRIAGGTYNLIAGTDGLHCDNDDSKLGYIYVADGTFDVQAESDCVEASGNLQLMNGAYVLRSSGAGIYARGDLLVANGTFDITSTCDTLHSKSNIVIEDGTITCSSGDDGIHADANVTVRGGKIDIIDSYEGIEGLTVDIVGGDITIFASDDGINAAGGKDKSGFGGGGGIRPDEFKANDNCYIKISGGTIRIRAIGDGIDSNGNLFMTGGTCYVNGPTANDNGALDYDGNAEITGGTLVAVGSSGMAQNFGNKSTQCSIMVTCSRTNGEVVLSTQSGEVLLQFSPSKYYTNVVVSCPQLKVGETYILKCGTQSQTIKLTGVIYGSGSGMGSGFNPGGPGGPGGRR